MAKQALQSASTGAGGPLALPHAWHVVLADGNREMVAAHDCVVKHGVLSFYNNPPSTDRILIRAFSYRDWRDVALVDTPFSPAVQLSVPEYTEAAR